MVRICATNPFVIHFLPRACVIVFYSLVCLGCGYVFSTSNCIYPGMPLSRYETMLDVWHKEGMY